MKVIHTIIFIFHITLVVNLLGSSIPFAGKISKDGINLEGQIKFFFQKHGKPNENQAFPPPSHPPSVSVPPPPSTSSKTLKN